MIHSQQLLGGVPERLIGAVLKTVVRASVPWVRIPPPPGFLTKFRGVSFISTGYNSRQRIKNGYEVLVKIYTDGACSGNPGKGGYGTILIAEDENGIVHKKELTQGFRLTTNNRMELLAAIAGLEALKKPCDVEIISDSKYLVDAFKQSWIDGWIKKGWRNSNKQPVKNKDLWERLLKAKEPHKVKFIWIKGHNGHEYNECCDKMAVNSSNSGSLLEDL